MSDERTQQEVHYTCDKSCEILKKTNDGDLLDPQHLKLTELAVNGHLNEQGKKAFEELYQRVIGGTYVRPYLHDIEHLTRDHEGYIYYKGNHVEHYDRDYVYSEEAKNNLLELKRRCEFLEQKGIAVSSGSAVWRWDEHADEYGAERLKELDSLLGNETKGLPYSRIEIYNSGREFVYFICGKPDDLEEIRNHPVTQGMIGRYFDDEYEITVKSYIYGKRLKNNLMPIDEIKNRTEVESLLSSCHNYLRAHDKLVILPEVTHKTDFAAGYESVKHLDSLIDRPGRSLQYSEIFMYGHGSDQAKLYIIGVPTFDDVKTYPEYEMMSDKYGDRLSVSVMTYQYGVGEPLTPEETQPLLTVPFIETLGEAHYYTQKHELSKEIGWKDFMHDASVRRTVIQSNPKPEFEDEYGCEP